MIVALVPARANSQRIPNKNLKPLDGKPLLFWTLSAVLKSNKVDHVVLSTESRLIVDAANEYVSGAFPHRKFTALQHPVCYSAPEVQTDTIFTYALWEFARTAGKMPDTLVLLAPTSPLRTTENIDLAITSYQHHSGKGTVVSVVRDKKFHWKRQSHVMEPLYHDPAYRAGGQWIADNDWLLCENGSIYVVDAKHFGAVRNYRIPPFTPYIMGEEHLLELDTELDWLIMESFLKAKKDASAASIS